MTEKYALNQLHQGLTYEQYAAERGLRASDLKLLKRSAAHWKIAQSRPPEPPSEALEFGKLFHAAIEHPEKFLDTHVVEPVFEGLTKDGKMSTRSAAAKDAKDAWYRDLKPGTLVVRKDWVEDLVGMLKAAMTHKNVGRLLKRGVREVSLFTDDPDTGVRLKCRPDFISEHGHMVDLKTTRDAFSVHFYNQIFSSKYPDDVFYCLQAAHYAHCARVSKVCNSDYFYFVAIEKESPYGIRVWPMDIGCMDPGEQWRAELTRLYAECDARGVWPCYDETVVPVTPPNWVELPGSPDFTPT